MRQHVRGVVTVLVIAAVAVGSPTSGSTGYRQETRRLSRMAPYRAGQRPLRYHLTHPRRSASPIPSRARPLGIRGRRRRDPAADRAAGGQLPGRVRDRVYARRAHPYCSGNPRARTGDHHRALHARGHAPGEERQRPHGRRAVGPGVRQLQPTLQPSGLSGLAASLPGPGRGPVRSGGSGI